MSVISFTYILHIIFDYAPCLVLVWEKLSPIFKYFIFEKNKIEFAQKLTEDFKDLFLLEM